MLYNVCLEVPYGLRELCFPLFFLPLFDEKISRIGSILGEIFNFNF